MDQHVSRARCGLPAGASPLTNTHPNTKTAIVECDALPPTLLAHWLDNAMSRARRIEKIAHNGLDGDRWTEPGRAPSLPGLQIAAAGGILKRRQASNSSGVVTIDSATTSVTSDDTR